MLTILFIGAAIGGALKVGGAIAGGIAASKAAKRARNLIKGELKANQDWYDRRYNESGTERADAQRLLTMADEQYRQRNRSAAGTAAVMGGTGESVAQEKAANAAGLASAISDIDVASESRKDSIENQYNSTRESLNDKLANSYTQQANAIRQAAQDVAAAGDGLMGALTKKS